MHADDWKGLGASLGLHLLVLLIFGLVAAGSSTPEPPVKLVELEIGPIQATRSEARRAARAPTPQPPRPEPREETRPTPAAPTPVKTPKPRTPPPAEQPLPKPPQEQDATPNRPATPAPTEAPTEGGTPAGDTGATSGAEDTDGTSDSGTSGLSIEGLGSRGATCAPPRYPGVSGTVTYAVTFSPEGRYIRSRPLRRGGDARIDTAVRRVIRSCRAEPLAQGASQVDQEGRVTFRFTN